MKRVILAVALFAAVCQADQAYENCVGKYLRQGLENSEQKNSAVTSCVEGIGQKVTSATNLVQDLPKLLRSILLKSYVGILFLKLKFCLVKNQSTNLGDFFTVWSAVKEPLMNAKKECKFK